MSHSTIIGNFGDESFQTTDCTRTENQKQGDRTLANGSTKQTKPGLICVLLPPARELSGAYSYNPDPALGHKSHEPTQRNRKWT